MTTRQLLQTSAAARNSVREILQLLFASELLLPSRCLWIVSPCLRDVPVLDNTTGAFLSLCPEFPRAEVRLSRVLRELLDRGTQVVIATRPGQENRQVFESIDDAAAAGRADALLFLERDDLHAKGIVGDRYCLIGSMNLTYRGIQYSTEMLVLETGRARIEELRIVFRNEYGGRA